jgi:hypothetical protein
LDIQEVLATTFPDVQLQGNGVKDTCKVRKWEIPMGVIGDIDEAVSHPGELHADRVKDMQDSGFLLGPLQPFRAPG